MPFMQPLAPKWRVETAAAFSQWPKKAERGVPRCMGFAVRVHREVHPPTRDVGTVSLSAS